MNWNPIENQKDWWGWLNSMHERVDGSTYPNYEPFLVVNVIVTTVLFVYLLLATHDKEYWHMRTAGVLFLFSLIAVPLAPIWISAVLVFGISLAVYSVVVSPQQVDKPDDEAYNHTSGRIRY